MPDPNKGPGCQCRCPDCRRRDHENCENKFHANIYRKSREMHEVTTLYREGKLSKHEALQRLMEVQERRVAHG